MNIEETKKLIINYIIDEYLDEDSDVKITASTPLISGGIVDSFSMVSLKTFLEKKFKVQIPDARATTEAFDSVDNIMVLLHEFVKA